MDSIDIDMDASAALPSKSQGAMSLESSRLLKTHSHIELKVCGQAADKYPSNYHAWSHRIWVIHQCLNTALQVFIL